CRLTAVHSRAWKHVRQLSGATAPAYARETDSSSHEQAKRGVRANLSKLPSQLVVRGRVERYATGDKDGIRFPQQRPGCLRRGAGLRWRGAMLHARRKLLAGRQGVDGVEPVGVAEDADDEHRGWGGLRRRGRRQREDRQRPEVLRWSAINIGEYVEDQLLLLGARW